MSSDDNLNKNVDNVRVHKFPLIHVEANNSTEALSTGRFHLHLFQNECFLMSVCLSKLGECLQIITNNRKRGVCACRGGSGQPRKLVG